VCIVPAVMKEGTEWDVEDLRERSFEITAFRPAAYDRRHERRRFAQPAIAPFSERSRARRPVEETRV
jgi:hypothetical protein